MFPPSHYKMEYAKTETLDDEKSLEIQNIGQEAKEAFSRTKVLGSPIATGILF